MSFASATYASHHGNISVKSFQVRIQFLCFMDAQKCNLQNIKCRDHHPLILMDNSEKINSMECFSYISFCWDIYLIQPAKLWVDLYLAY